MYIEVGLTGLNFPIAKHPRCLICSVTATICIQLEGSYLPSNRNSPESEQIENALLAILISTE